MAKTSSIPLDVLENIDANTLKLFIKFLEMDTNEKAELNRNLGDIKKSLHKVTDFIDGTGEKSFTKVIDSLFNKYKLRILAWIGGITVAGIITYLISIVWQAKEVIK